ncbi:transcription factor SPT20 homolog isoform X2 [Ornithodoros turicata]|uniref:transcription factor SPT20 homolog isoform X2 n=1 Tax=Ornithodoros turicata TaxID=34597 RepID=UPI003138F158
MRLAVLAVLALATVVAAGVREKRQVQYQPEAAPRGSAPQSQDQYAQQQQLQGFRQTAPQQQQYDQSAFQQQAPRGRTTVQSFGGGLARPQQSSQQSSNSNSQSAEEEEEEQPNPLTLLLEKSTFTCGGKSDGYYSDNSVQCQVFHYCVGGAKHSWMCPEGTVFHQVHLNCVPASQDICQQAEKFFFVNDYLHKELENRGPNNTVLYAQRYYPDGYVLGDPFTLPSGGRSQPQPQQQQQQQHFPPQAQPQPQSPPASVPFRQPQPAQRRPQPAQFQPQQFPAAAPPQYTIQPQPQPQQGTGFRGAAPSAGQSGRNAGGASPFSFPPTRTYTIPAPGAAAPAARAPEANPAYIYRQAAPSQGQHSSVKYDDDY